jgi:hypothetical protein
MRSGPLGAGFPATFNGGGNHRLAAAASPFGLAGAIVGRYTAEAIARRRKILLDSLSNRVGEARPARDRKSLSCGGGPPVRGSLVTDESHCCRRRRSNAFPSA